MLPRPFFPIFLVAGLQVRALDAGLDVIGHRALADGARIQTDFFGLVPGLACVAEDLVRIEIEAVVLFHFLALIQNLLHFDVVFLRGFIKRAQFDARDAAIGQLGQIDGLAAALGCSLGRKKLVTSQKRAAGPSRLRAILEKTTPTLF